MLPAWCQTMPGSSHNKNRKEKKKMCCIYLLLHCYIIILEFTVDKNQLKKLTFCDMQGCKLYINCFTHKDNSDITCNVVIFSSVDLEPWHGVF